MSDNVPIKVSHRPETGNTSATLQRRLRLVLDSILILLIVLIASGQRLAVRAGIDQQSATDARVAVASGVGEASVPKDAQPAPASLDNQTLAAMIAAENAALTPPLYFNTLPLIVH